MLVVLVVVVAGSASFFLFWWLSFYFGNLLLEKRGIVLSSNTAASFNHLPPLWHSKNSHPPIHTLTNRQDGATPTPTAAAFALHADWHFKLKLNALLPCIIMPFIYVHTFYFWVLILRTWLHSDLPTHAHMPSPHTKRTFNISACDLFLAHFPVKMEHLSILNWLTANIGFQDDGSGWILIVVKELGNVLTWASMQSILSGAFCWKYFKYLNKFPTFQKNVFSQTD